MEKLRAYLKSLSAEKKVEFALKCETTIGSLHVAMSKKTKLGAKLSVSIEQNSGGAVTRKDLHPTDWFKIWPEI